MHISSLETEFCSSFFLFQDCTDRWPVRLRWPVAVRRLPQAAPGARRRARRPRGTARGGRQRGTRGMGGRGRRAGSGAGAGGRWEIMDHNHARWDIPCIECVFAT
jgi:hypothetical protein